MIKIKNRSGKVIRTVDADTLIGADLRGADLRGADLRGADLRGAGLYDANFYTTNSEALADIRRCAEAS